MMLFAWLLLALSPWFYPGVTRPEPGPVLAAGGWVALAAALSWRSPRRALGFLLVLLWWTLCSRVSLDPYRSEVRLASLTGGVGVACLLLQRAQSCRAWRATALLMALVALALSLVGLDQPLLASTFSNPDSFCVLPLVGALLAAGLGIGNRGREAVFWQLLTLCLAGAVVLTGSRAGLLALAVGFVVLLARGAPLRSLALAWLGLALLTLSSGGGRLGALLRGEDQQGLQMRRDVLVYGTSTALHYPVLGSGPGTFSLAYQEFRPVRAASVLPASLYVNVAHNDLVEVAVETGLPGLGLWIGLQLWAVGAALKTRRMRNEATAVLACLAALAVFSCLNFVLAVPVLLLWWFALLGLALALPHEPAEMPRSVLPPVLFLAGLLAMMLGAQVTRANRCLSEASHLSERMRWEEALSLLDQAARMLPSRARTYLERARLQANLAMLEEAPTRSAGEDLLEAYRRSPRDPAVVRARVEELCRQGHLAQAERLLQRAHRQMPYQDWVLQDLLRVQVLQSHLGPACATLRELSQRDPGYLEPLANLLAENPAFGVAQLDAWTSWPLVDRVASLAAARQPAAFSSWLSRRHPEDLSCLLRASSYQSDPDPSLERILQQARPDDPVYEQALIAWSARSPTRLPRLATFVQDHPDSLGGLLALCDRVPPERARALLARALADHGSDARLQLSMGKALVRLGSSELARDYFGRALQLEPGNSEARAELNRLR